ncbi:unnamed protein product [Effrenium voratum]|nr:unnamed protein product [Effrenium voratum]
MSLLKHGDEAFASMGFAYPHMTAEACCVLEALRLTRFARAGPQSSSQQEVGIGRDRLAVSWPNAMAEMCDDFCRDYRDFITDGVETYDKGVGLCVVADVLPGMSLLKHGDEAFASVGFAYPHMTAEACCVLEVLRLSRIARASPQ